ncbi:MAG: DUF177 domain-containing protein [Alphaproteobacteria bacterium]|nr:DUF177 domain-containing protein [Alphaproteobacteria bacterium]
MTAPSARELRRPVEIASLPEGGRDVAFTASSEECAAIAARLDLLDLADFRVSGRLEPLRRGRAARFEAHLSARVTQACVVSLDPVESRIEEDISTELVDEAEAEALAATDPEETEERDWEVLEEGAVDLGELAVQHLALALDPYPKRPDLQDEPPVTARSGGQEEESEAEAADSNPFAVLKRLKDKA